jgi:hypothetical protein
MKTQPLKPYDPLRVKLSAFEQLIEDSLDESAPLVHATPELMEQVRQAAQRSLAKLRGGKRAGAGRKPREYVKTTVLIAPDVRQKLTFLAARHGSLSRAVEEAVRAAK